MKTATITEYGLRILSPDGDVLEDFSSSTPFQAIEVGHEIHQVNASLRRGKGLRATGIFHQLHHLNEGVMHLTGVRTEEIDLAE